MATTERTITVTNARHPELAQYIADHAIRFGDFTLTSGRSSTYYCDAKQASFAPRGALLIADAVLREMEGLEVDAVGGMDMGATPIVAAVALRSLQLDRPLPTFVVRKEAKTHGVARRVEGLYPGSPSRLVIVDDVVTSGGSIIDAIEVVRDAGHAVVLALSVVDREAGGAQRLAELDVTYRPLVTISELGISNDAG